VHETPVNELTLASSLAVVCSNQRAPFQRSASATTRPRWVNDPTAVQAVGDEHDTPSSELPPVSIVGVLCIDHLPLRQRSTRVERLPAVSTKYPTAVQSVWVEHDTASSVLKSKPGLGVVWTDQSTPFQRSARVDRLPPATKYPTAVHALADVHETPLSTTLSGDPGGIPAPWTEQKKPFQLSTSGSSMPIRWMKNPTAIQLVVVGHDTP
jgi:hypothetical protein